MKKIISTVEARMTSARLPGKVLKEAVGMPMLEVLIRRLKKVDQLQEIVIATTTNKADDAIVELARNMKVSFFRGSEEDVLSRVLCAAKEYIADIIVEITGDCPLVDPQIVTQAINLYMKNSCDYVCNIEPVTFPIGMDVQIFSTDVLALVDRESVTLEDREHVSWFIRRQPKRFKILNFSAPPNLFWPDLSLTLDEYEDYLLLKNIIEHFSPDMHFSCGQMLDYLRNHPELLEINKNVKRKEPSR